MLSVPSEKMTKYKIKRLAFLTSTVYLVLTSPIIGTFWASEYSRYVIVETWSHWTSRKRDVVAVFCGDSTVAGGRHWVLDKSIGYLSTINLSGNGYTIRQSISQVRKANSYSPKHIVVAAGTNDAFSILDNRQTILESVSDFRELVETAQSPLLITLPLPTRNDNINKVLTPLREEMRKAAQESNVETIDLWDLFLDEEGLLRQELTTDGVHLTEKAYEIWIAELNRRIRSR